jgi:hypothetical protein
MCSTTIGEFKRDGRISGLVIEMLIRHEKKLWRMFAFLFVSRAKESCSYTFPIGFTVSNFQYTYFILDDHIIFYLVLLEEQFFFSLFYYWVEIFKKLIFLKSKD